MKVFTIGSEGAGKTVFATMLDQYLQKNALNIQTRITDRATAEYLSKTFRTLSSGEWTPSTKGGDFVELKWEWQKEARTLDFSLIDCAGQDIRSALNGGSDPRNIVGNMETADVLILLVDLYDHQFANDGKKFENKWIINRVLQAVDKNRKENRQLKQKLLFCVTKADKISELKEANWTNCDEVLSIVKNYMPKIQLGAYMDLLKSPVCSVFAFASVCSTKNKSEGGQLISLPSVPLQSKGLEKVVQEIEGKWIQREKNRRTKYMALSCVGLLAIFAVYLFIFPVLYILKMLYLWVQSF